MSYQNNNVTRGYGLLEGYLGKKRYEIANKLIPLSHRTGHLLDIGCGTYPYFLININMLNKFGVGNSINQKYNFDKYGNRISLKNLDIEKNILPFNSEFFDVVTMLAVFEHISIDRISKVVNEIYRILKPGGIFIITTPAIWTEKLLKAMCKFGLVSPAEINDHKDTYNFKKISAFLSASGFSVNNMCFGHFELFMNTWVKALK